MTARFQPTRVIEVLNRHGVEYVLIGGLAATLHGSTLRTFRYSISRLRPATST